MELHAQSPELHKSPDKTSKLSIELHTQPLKMTTSSPDNTSKLGPVKSCNHFLNTITQLSKGGPLNIQGGLGVPSDQKLLFHV